MSRNVEDYGFDPEEFRPERFVDTDARDPAEYVFGFGRRCEILFSTYSLLIEDFD